MSINPYSTDIPETTPWWTTQQHQGILMEAFQNPSTSEPPIVNPSWPSHIYHLRQPYLNSHTPQHPPGSFFNLNQHDEDDNGQPPLHDQPTSSHSPEHQAQKEAMFEKPLTPSDVGKLNRLVIPKQHAEKYFPLGDSGESKGLSLSFEDESGKCWRFRYSYWNSSQSYVLTKGWSRYVKDKHLDAGDVVLFERHRTDAHRLFISWRRRHQSRSTLAHVSRAAPAGLRNTDGHINNNNGVGGVGVELTRGFYSAHPYPTHHPLPYQPDCLHAGRADENKTTPVGNTSSSRVLRLFGVNMECQPEESGSSRPECSYMSSTQGTTTQHQFYAHYHLPSYSSINPPHHHMGSRLINRMHGCVIAAGGRADEKSPRIKSCGCDILN